jgi:hypothetical protein
MRVAEGAYRTGTQRDGTTYHLHRLDGTRTAPPLPLPPGGTAPDRADPDTLHAVYSALLAALPLAERHREALRCRGLSDAEIDRRGYGTLPVQGRARVARGLRERWGDTVVRVPGIVARERDGRRYLTLAGAAGLLVPVRDTSGRVVALLVRRDDAGGGPRYVYLSSARDGGPGPGASAHVPRGVTAPCPCCRLTEGALKADVAHALSGLPTVGCAGLAWRPALAVLRELGCQTVRLALDADAADKPAVARVLETCADALAVARLAVELERWPAAAGKGIDDVLAAGATPEVLTGDVARQAIAEIVAEGTAGEPPPPPDPLERLPEVLAEGAEALYRDRPLLRALAALAEADPAEYQCRRAQLHRAGVRLRGLDAALAPLRQAIRAARPPRDAAGSYRIVAGRIVHVRPTAAGDVEVPLACWSARIVEEVLHDDGTERQLVLAVEGALADGTPLPRALVSSDQYAVMRWPVAAWGARAVVLAGPGTADHLRAAVQLLSGDVPRRTVYAHAGWREVAGRWLYLHAGGALGPSGPAAGVEVDLPDSLAGYALPDPPDGAELAEAIRASLSVLDVAPDPITAPLLGAVYRAVLGPADYALHLAGPTGAGKTELAARLAQHWGAGLDARHLPGTWGSTALSLLELAHAAADAVLVVDDYAPGGATGDGARLAREADRLLRAAGNRSGRGRCRRDGTPQPARPPRGTILSTGEDAPPGQSLRARLLVLELAPGELDWVRLTACQRDAAAGLYAQALAGYVRWLAPRIAAVRAGLGRETAALRERVREEGLHARTPGIVADLAAGWRWWLDYALAAGAIDQGGRDAMARRTWQALRAACSAQAAHVAAADPVAHYLRLLAGALASGRAHVADLEGGAPPDAGAWGWRSVEVGTGQYQRTDWQPQGRCVGWLDGADLLLQPDAAYAAAQQLAHDQGDSLAVTEWTLRRRLAERGLLQATGSRSGRVQLTVRRVAGGARREVLHLAAECLSVAPATTPSTPLAPAVGENGVQPRGSQPPGRALYPTPLPHGARDTAASGAATPPDGVDGVVLRTTDRSAGEDIAPPPGAQLHYEDAAGRPCGPAEAARWTWEGAPGWLDAARHPPPGARPRGSR